MMNIVPLRKDKIPDITAQMVATYREVDSLNHLGHCPLPNYEVIISCLEDLKEILFPGYRRREFLHWENVTYCVGSVIDRLHDRLRAPDCPGFCVSAAGDDATCTPEQRVFYERLGDERRLPSWSSFPSYTPDP